MPHRNAAAVVTGAGSGIGRALSVELMERGYFVFLVGRNEATLQATADLAKSKLHRIVCADVTEANGRDRIVEAVTAHFPALDMLVNNAGIVKVGTISTTSDEDLRRLTDTNLVAPLALTRDLLPALMLGRNPRIVNIGSMFGDIAFPFFAAYSATKFGLRGASDALRRELATSGIKVTYVAPRATDTGAADQFRHLIDPFSMTLDTPIDVAKQIVSGIDKGRREIYPCGAETLYRLVQKLVPSLIDRSIIKQVRDHARHAINKISN